MTTRIMIRQKLTIPSDVKYETIRLGGGKCANKPGSRLRYLESYRCPRWINYGGDLELSNYHIDRIVPLALGGNNSLFNLQILCLDCHSIKDKLVKKQRQRLRTPQQELYTIIEISSSVTIPPQSNKMVQSSRCVIL